MSVDDSLGLCDEGVVVLGSLHFWSWLCWSDMIGALCDESLFRKLCEVETFAVLCALCLQQIPGTYCQRFWVFAFNRAVCLRV